MQGEIAFVTVECLRGRLQAERAASTAAEQNVELLAIKLQELEKQLKIETKIRRKAEKKLSVLKKKLESLNIPFKNIISEESERLSSSSNSEISCMTSISTSFNHHEDHIPASRASKSSSITSEVAEEVTESEISMEPKVQIDHSNGRQVLDENCQGFLQVALEKKSNKVEFEEKQDDNDVNNSMALVPMSPIIELNHSSDGTLEIKSEKVREVLDTLKQIKKNLQSSLERRRIIKVG